MRTGIRFIAVMVGAWLLAGDAGAADPSQGDTVLVMVVRNDMKAGATLSYDDIAQRPMPSWVLTSSLVGPSSANYVVGQKLLAPLLAGDLVRWSQFETEPAAYLSACDAALGESSTAVVQVARARRAVLTK